MSNKRWQYLIKTWKAVNQAQVDLYQANTLFKLAWKEALRETKKDTRLPEHLVVMFNSVPHIINIDTTDFLLRVEDISVAMLASTMEVADEAE